MSVIVNRFGLDTCSIIETFSMMGPSHILDPEVHAETLNIFMFARSQVLDGEVIPPPRDIEISDIRGYFTRKSSKYNKAFMNWDDEKIEEMKDFLTTPHNRR